MSVAQKLAAQRALAGLVVTPDVAVVDGNWDFVSPHVGHVVRRIKADARCLSVAAASILAKVVHNREMRAHAEHYPHWSFDTNKGYPCPVHKAALQGLRPVGDPPPHVGLHGPLRPVARRPPDLPPRPRPTYHSSMWNGLSSPGARGCVGVRGAPNRRFGAWSRLSRRRGPGVKVERPQRSEDERS